jgi:hypothetical protein
MGQSSFLLCGLLGQNVTFEGVLSLDLTRSGYFKPFLRTPVGLHLWHNALFF